MMNVNVFFMTILGAVAPHFFNSEGFRLDNLSKIGLIILVCCMVSKVVQRIGVPQVVGFIITGVLLGSSFLNFVPMELVNQMNFISEIALGLIGFGMGAHLRFGDIRRFGKSVFIILLGEGLGSFLVVTAGVYLVSGSLPMALIMGALASATAPAATVDVLEEYKAEGPLTTNLLAVVGMDDVLALMLYSIAVAVSEVMLGGAETLSVFEMVLVPLWEITGSVLLGVMIALPFEWFLDNLKLPYDACGFITSVVLLTAGLANSLGLSLILSCMVLGMVLTNVGSDNSKCAHGFIDRVGPPIYILFFAMAGARLQIGLLPQMGLIGLAYLVLRTSGKIGGVWLGGRLGGAEPVVRDNLGFALLSQAGVAIGLCVAVAQKFGGYGGEGEHIANIVVNTVTATTFVVQILGPIMVKFAINRAGEIGRGREAVCI